MAVTRSAMHGFSDMARVIECWGAGHLLARHRCSEELSNREIFKRFGIGERFTVIIYPEHRPDLSETIQTERTP